MDPATGVAGSSRLKKQAEAAGLQLDAKPKPDEKIVLTYVTFFFKGFQTFNMRKVNKKIAFGRPQRKI